MKRWLQDWWFSITLIVVFLLLLTYAANTVIPK